MALFLLRFLLRRRGLRLRHPPRLRRRPRRRRGLRLLLRLRLRRRARLLRADRLDLDLGQRGAEAGVTPVTGPLTVLADADLRPAALPDHARGHRDVLRRKLRLAVAADEQDRRRKRLPVLGIDAIDEQALTLADAVLLPADGDDRVAHENLRTLKRRAGAR